MPYSFSPFRLSANGRFAPRQPPETTIRRKAAPKKAAARQSFDHRAAAFVYRGTTPKARVAQELLIAVTRYVLYALVFHLNGLVFGVANGERKLKLAHLARG